MNPYRLQYIKFINDTDVLSSSYPRELNIDGTTYPSILQYVLRRVAGQDGNRLETYLSQAPETELQSDFIRAYTELCKQYPALKRTIISTTTPYLYESKNSIHAVRAHESRALNQVRADVLQSEVLPGYYEQCTALKAPPVVHPNDRVGSVGEPLLNIVLDQPYYEDYYDISAVICAGADPSMQSWHHMSPIHAAISKNDYELVHQLLYGTMYEPTVTSDLLVYAIKTGNSAVLDVLLSYPGAFNELFEPASYMDKTPLDVAFERHDKHNKKFILGVLRAKINAYHELLQL